MQNEKQTSERIFNDALRAASAEERDALLKAACGDDASLRAKVEALLLAHQEAGEFLATPGGAIVHSDTVDSREAGVFARPGSSLGSAVDETHVGESARSAGSLAEAMTLAPKLDAEPLNSIIGPYKLREKIGEGGFGVVYLAEQEKPVRRRVALKVIKLGMDTRQVIARFEAERQALAMMDHPNIARVLDAGATETGRPYFVMELVRGVPITQYCDDNNLTPQQRLELFVSVCQAVQHAHQKGIIHRDIKPNNVLVSRHDDKPVVKVIDFGIAKATGARLTEKTVFTELRQMIGTPTYMSPEQAGLSDLDIDTRSDIYSLGVLLYELLTGTTPFDIKSLMSAGYAEIQRIIREVEPPRPSTRLSTMKDALPSVAAQRKTEPGRLTKLVRGDLDWIVMKCLEKDRGRRYETANGLAADIQRYIDGEAVVAAPPSQAYRLQKFVKRNRAAVMAGLLVAIALLLGVAGTSYGLVWALRERDRAAKEASRAQALNEFMRHMILAANPENAGDREITVVEMLLKASEKADKTLQNEPIAEGEARTFLASTLRAIGKVEEAEKEGRRAVELRENGPERDTLHHAESLRSLAHSLSAQGAYQEALEGFQKALAILKSVAPPQPKELYMAYLDVAQVLNKLGRYAEAEKTLDEGDAFAIRWSPQDLDSRADYRGCRATIAFGWRGDLEKAEELQSQCVAMRRQVPAANLLADALNSLAIVKTQRGKHDEALKLYQECLEIQRKEFGDVHQMVAVSLENMASLYFSQKKYDKALSQLEQVLAIRTQLFGADSFPAARTRFNMGVLASRNNDPSHGLELINGALPVFRKQLGEKNVEVGQVLRARAFCHKSLGDLDQALEDNRAALAIFDSAIAATAPMRLNTVVDTTELLCLQGSFPEAERLVKKSLDLLDPAKAEHAQWIKKLNEKLALRAGHPTESQPASATSRSVGGG